MLKLSSKSILLFVKILAAIFSLQIWTQELSAQKIDNKIPRGSDANQAAPLIYRSSPKLPELTKIILQTHSLLLLF